MLKRLMFPALAATLTLAACDLGPTAAAPSAQFADDYALVMFGEPGTALEGTMGPQGGPRPFDGRTGRPALPEELKLSEEQKAEMQALREAFRAEHAEQLDALKAIFEEARAARQAGASRDEVRAILMQGREIAFSLRPAVHELHLALRAVLTDAQRAWLEANRPRRMPRPMHG